MNTSLGLLQSVGIGFAAIVLVAVVAAYRGHSVRVAVEVA